MMRWSRWSSRPDGLRAYLEQADRVLEFVGMNVHDYGQTVVGVAEQSADGFHAGQVRDLHSNMAVRARQGLPRPARGG